MSEQLKIAVRFGIYGGVLAFIVALIMLLSGNSPYGDAGWMAIWIPVVSIWFALVQIKKSEGQLPFKKAFLYGTVTLTVYALIYDVVMYFFGLFNNMAVELFKQETLLKFEQNPDIFGGSNADLYQKLIEQTQVLTLEQVVFSDFLYKLLGGLFLVLAIANFVRTRATDLPNQTDDYQDVIDENNEQ